MARITAEVEGTIESVAPDSSGSGVEIRAMGIKIVFVPGTTASLRPKKIKTPSQQLTPAEFLSTVTFPGRTSAGFVGGTVIAEGTFNTNTGIQQLDADFLTVEPAESVLAGALTQNVAGTPPQIRVNGVPVVMLTDTRLSSNPNAPATPHYLNQYGFPMQISSALVASVDTDPPTSVEGYYASGVFHAFKFEYGGTGLLLQNPSTTPQISLERAQIDDTAASFDVEARGWVTASHAGATGISQRVEILRGDIDPVTLRLVETSLGAAVDIDPVEAGVQRWRFRETIAKDGGINGRPPEIIVARNLSVPRPTNATQPEQPRVQIDADIREE